MKTHKRCSICKIEKPVSEFYKDKRVKDGYESECKSCHNAHSKKEEFRARVNEKARQKTIENREIVVQNKEQKRLSNIQARKSMIEKKCPKCGLVKSIDNFYWNNNTNNWASYCKRCLNGHQKTEKRKRYLKKWHSENKHVDTIQRQRRRARLENLADDFTEQDYILMMNYWNEKCCICGKENIALDHWIPVSSQDCTGTIPSNIVPLCHGIGGCNNKKGDSDAYQWMCKEFNVDFAESKISQIEEYFQLVRQVDISYPELETKMCAACNCEKTIKSFRKNPRSRGERSIFCKECSSDIKLYRRIYRTIKPEVARKASLTQSRKRMRIIYGLQDDQTFYCDTCDEERPYWEFYFSKGVPHRHKVCNSYMKKYPGF